MGRLDKYPINQFDESEVHDDNISTVLSDLSEKQTKTVIWDIDSIIFHALHEPKDENGNSLPEYTLETISAVKFKIDELFTRHLNNVKKYFNIEELFIFISGRKNFRKVIYPEYKAKRKGNELRQPLVEYIIEKYQAKPSDGFEADDYVYSASLLINHAGIILTTDGDLDQIPGIHYNYQKDYWYTVDEQKARHNTAFKVMIGDSGDNVNLSPKIGKKYAEEHLKLGMSDYQYIKHLYIGYLKAWKGNSVLAKTNLRLAYKLLRLHYVLNSN